MNGDVIGLLQRVSSAQVQVDGQCVGEIGHGLLVLVGVEPEDRESVADRLLGYRVFSDTDEK